LFSLGAIANQKPHPEHMNEFLRGAIYGSFLLITCVVAWILLLASHFVLAFVAVYFPHAAIAMLPLCFVIPALLVLATTYLILRDFIKRNR
jgi:hypothetical protein